MRFVTNEPPENTQPTPPIEPETDGAAAGAQTGGQHGFRETFSSDAAAPAPEPAAQAQDQAAAAPEPVVPPSEEVVAAPAEQPIVAPVSEAPAYPQAASGGHAYPGAPGYPGAAQTAPNAPAHDPNAAAYPANQSPYDPNAAAYPANAPLYEPNQPGGGYPAGAYPGAAPVAPKKPMSKGLLFGIIGGVAALVLLIAAVIIVPNLLRGPAPTASDAVETYLTALSEGDAETALGFIMTSGDTSLLTDEVLTASQELAPIDDIVVEDDSEGEGGYESVISASFTIGGEAVEREFTVYSSDDSWVISDGLIFATLSNFAGLDPTVNGVTPADPETLLFPGAYQIGLGYEEFALDADTDTFTLATDADSEQFWDIYPVLTDDGAATFRSLVRAAIEECVAMKTLATPCGMDLTDIDLTGYTPVEDSVTRTVPSEEWSEFDSVIPEVDYSTPSIVSTYETPSVDMTLQGTKDGTTSEFEVWLGGYMDNPTVDFSEETPTVTWE